MVQTVDESMLEETFGAVQMADNGKGFHLLHYSSERETKDAQELLSRHSNVKYAEVNRVLAMPKGEDVLTNSTSAVKMDSTTKDSIRRTETMISDFPYEGWGADRIGADDFIEYLDQNGKLTSDNEILVAVIDSGVSMDHPIFNNDHPLTERRRIADMDALEEKFGDDFRINFSGLGSNTAVNGANNHGTFVSGIIVGCTPDNVKILPFKINNRAFSQTSQANVVLAIRAATEYGAKVINMSLTYEDADGTMGSQQAYECAFGDAIAQGAIGVVDAGNARAGGVPADVGLGAYYPANCANTITVAATGGNTELDLQIWQPNDEIAGFSYFGERVDVAAPGVNIWSSDYDERSGDNFYGYFSGTSYATPHVAAVATLIMLDNPNVTPEGIKEIICKTVDVPIGWNSDSQSTPYYGTGVLDLNYYIEVMPTISDLEYNGTEFTFTTIDLSSHSALGSYFDSVYVVIKRYNASDIETGVDSDTVTIDSSGGGTYEPGLTSFSQYAYLEISVYRNTPSQNLITRQVIRPKVFAFS